MLRPIAFWFLWGTAVLSCAAAQNSSLERRFQPDQTEQYRVELIVRSEAQGQRAEKIGARAYAAPFSTFSQERISWNITRRVLSVAADGIAEVEEKLENFTPLAEPPPNAHAGEKGKADAALKLALLEWTRAGTIVLRYRESPPGEVRGLGADAAPVLDAEPAVLTLWLRRNLRPSAALRGARGGPETRWSESRDASLPPWKNAQGNETGEWMPGPSPERSAVRFDNLHVTQQITATVPAREALHQDGQARFHAESVSTVVGAGAEIYGGYGSVAQAARSASREVSYTLAPVFGLAEPPRFRSVLSVEIRITRSDGPPK